MKILPCRRTRDSDLWSRKLAMALADNPLAEVIIARPSCRIGGIVLVTRTISQSD